MADIFYPFSREEAKRENRLEDWGQSHRLNVKCARDIENLITAHAQEGQLESDCARAALDWWGFHRVKFVLANTLVGTGGLGFEPDSLRWARSVFVPPDQGNAEFRVQADRALLAAFVQQAHAEYQKLGMFGPEHCEAGDLDYTGRVLLLRPDRMKEECLSPQNLVWYGETGFGCSPTASGRAVFATCLGDGERARWNRSDFIGVLDEQHLPDWAMERLAELRAPAQEQTDSPTQMGSPQKRPSAFVGGGEAREHSGECPEGVSHEADFASTMEMG